MAARGLGIDEGSATQKAVEVEAKDGAFVPTHAVAVPASEGGAGVTAALAAALAAEGVKSKSAVLGLTGKDLVVRYQQVPPVADFQLKKIVAFELDEIRKQSGDELAADFNVMPVRADLTTDDIVLLALTREQRIAERSAALAASKLAARHFTPNAVALYHAFRVFGPATSGVVMVASIGRATSDFAVIRDGDLLYARSVNTGGDVLTDAIAEQFNVSKGKAESLKVELGDLRPRDKRQGLSPQSEKVSYALEGAAGRVFSLLQSTLQLAKAQMQLNALDVTKVWITGGSAATKGLDDYLAASLGVPVVKFDPLADASVACSGAPTISMTVAAGLAVMAADPQAWSLEVIGAAARKRREFARRHVFTLAALLLVAVYLAVAFVRWSDRHELASQQLTRLRKESDRRKANAKRLEDLVAERADLAARLDVLEKRKASGDSLLRALDLVATQLPEDLWVSSLELDFRDPVGVAKDKGVKRPVIVIDGAGKSRGSRNVDQAYVEFVAALQALPPTSEVKPEQVIESQSTAREKFDYRLELGWVKEPKPPPPDESAPRPKSDKSGKGDSNKKPGGP
jgi:type IV pilus assembly protein PilM